MKFRQVDRRALLVRRAWSEKERRIVWRGLTGRTAIAIEPLAGTLFFSLLTWGVIWRARHVEPSLIVLSPIFALGALAFMVYFIAVLVAPLRAYWHTFKPIYRVDGYVRYRGPDVDSEDDATGYVAVLFEDRGLACEWECFGKSPLPDLTLPAFVEFSAYGGIHAIDGKPTGVLPDDELPTLAIGMASRR